jgi:uncharacterized protein
VIGAAANLATATVVLDDRDARQWAHDRGQLVAGTVAIPVETQSRQLLPALRPTLDRLRATGFFLSDRLYNAALVATGE